MICASLMAGTMERALEKMSNYCHHDDLLELRIDMIADLDLPVLMQAKRGPVIITNRRREEGGGFRGTEKERISLLCEAIRLKADYVDLEAATEDELARRVLGAAAGRRSHTRIIVSFHNYTATPPEASLRKIWNTCRERGGHIVKIATYARYGEDNLRVLSLIPYSLKRGQEIIAFCMGEEGRVSRVMAPLLGSYLAYAALDKGEEAAPGQMTVKEMKQVLKILTPFQK